jgi:hypothetical protein
MPTITIAINGIEHTYTGDYDTLHNNDWSDIIREHIDSQADKERVPGMPGFEGTWEALDSVSL